MAKSEKKAVAQAPAKKGQYVVLDRSTEQTSFVCCPHGVQFRSKDKLEQDKIFSMTLHLPKGEEFSEVSCTGMVVDSEPMADAYNNLIYFLDLPESAREHIACMSAQSSSLCSQCHAP